MFPYKCPLENESFGLVPANTKNWGSLAYSWYKLIVKTAAKILFLKHFKTCFWFFFYSITVAETAPPYLFKLFSLYVWETEKSLNYLFLIYMNHLKQFPWLMNMFA